jgi:hypothetical protein
VTELVSTDEAQQIMSAQQNRVERSLKRLGFQLAKGRGKAFKLMTIAGATAPNSTDTMSLDQVESWIGDHIKPKR